jgi:CrcB protein
MIKSIICVAFGGALGSVGRFLLSKVIQSSTSSVFPWGTMVVNILGCLIIGMLYAAFERFNVINPHLRLLLTMGFCGGFTTFSTFMNESLGLFRDGNPLFGATYVGGSFFTGFLAVYLGSAMIKAI